MVSKVDMVRCWWCWSMLVGNGSMLIKGRVETRREEWGLVMLIIISCFWDGGKCGWGMCFINEGRWWLAKVGCRASLVVGRWFRVLFSVAESIRVEVGADGYGSSKGFGVEAES